MAIENPIHSEIDKQFSKLRFYSMGIVTAHKPEGTDIIRVNLRERVTMDNGPLDSDKDTFDVQSTNSQGVSESMAVDVERIVEALWIPDGDNHLLTSPDVRASETVKVFRYGDTQEFFWTTCFREPQLRRLENVLYGFSNLKDGFAPHTTESSYYMQWDTIRKAVRIVTTQSDGEAFGYIFEINPAESTVKIEDSVGNIILMESQTNNISLTDISGGRFESRDGFPKITGPKGIELEAPLTKVIGKLQVTSSTRIDGSTSIGGGLVVSGYASFPGGHGPH